MIGWKQARLGDIVDLQQGLAINKKSRHLKVSKSHLPLLRITDLINNKNEQFIDDKKVPNQFIADGKSLIYTRTGQVGLVFRGRYGVVHNNCFKVIPKNSLDINYLFYLLKHSNIYKNVILSASKSAQPDITHSAFKAILTNVPTSTDTQSAIASVISTYDDLIENNQKRIKVLEEMAQRLYTEWFVKFNFPGNENVKMVDSGTEFGEIPNGWEVKKLNEVINIIRGKSYSSSEIDSEDGKYYLVNLKSFNRGGGFRFDGEKYFNGSVNSNQLLAAGDIVIAVTDMTTDRAVIARPAMIPKINHDQVTMSADVVKVESKLLSKMFLYYLLLDENFTSTTKAKANGANVLHLKPILIGEYFFILPPTELIEKFEEVVSKHAFLINLLNNRNDQLSKIRDLLIENLITGKRLLKG